MLHTRIQITAAIVWPHNLCYQTFAPIAHQIRSRVLPIRVNATAQIQICNGSAIIRAYAQYLVRFFYHLARVHSVQVLQILHKMEEGRALVKILRQITQT